MREYLLCSAIVLLATSRLWAGSTTPFQLGPQGGVIVPVTMNGEGPFMMLLDTGATHSAITESAAAAIGARAVAKSHVLSPTDTTIRLIVAIDALTVGPNDVDLVLPSVVPDGSLGRDGAVVGLLGQDVLAWLRYTIDFRQRTIEWHDRPPARPGVQLALTFEHGRFLVNLRHAGEVLRLVPDSGAGGLVLFSVGGRVRTGMADTGKTVEVLSATARGVAREVLLRELHVGDRTLRDLRAVVIDRPDVRPAEGDGLLPLHLFERVTFDGPARLMIVG